MKYTANDKPTVRPERLEQARRLLQDLPEKDTRISKRETVTRLESDIRKTLKKGYSYREIAADLKSAGLVVSAQLIKEVVEPESKKETLKEEAQSNAELAQNLLETERVDGESILEKDTSTRAEIISKVLEKAEAEKTMTNNSRGQFVIKPDRAKGEL